MYMTSLLVRLDFCFVITMTVPLTLTCMVVLTNIINSQVQG